MDVKLSIGSNKANGEQSRVQENQRKEFLVSFVLMVLFFSVVAGGFLVFLLSLPVIFITSWIWVPVIVILNWAVVKGYLGNAMQKTHSEFLDRYTRSFSNLFRGSYNWVMYKSNRVKRISWRVFYGIICRLYPKVEWTTMNYGFAYLNETGHSKDALEPADEPQRFSYQLYHIVASGLGSFGDLRGRTVLEVGCGRGGGSKYVKQYMHAQKCIGIDFSRSQIRFCQKANNQIPDLYYYQGDAEHFADLPELSGQKIDAVLNVESSHCYGNLSRFIGNVSKVLSNEGYFMYTDFMTPEDLQRITKIFEEHKLEIVRKDDITLNVIRSMELDEPRRLALIDQMVHRILRPIAKKFSGVKGSQIYRDFKNRDCLYMAFLLQKKE